MQPDVGDEGALLPLRDTRDEIFRLRAGGLDARAGAAAVVRVADAVEASLRRWLRDDPDAPMPVRLQALAADELAVEGVLAELRQRDRISIELAAAVHELLNARRRLANSGSATPADAEVAVRTADRTEAEIARFAAASPRPAAKPAPLSAEATQRLDTLPTAAAAPARRGGWVSVALVLLLIVAGAWWATQRRESEFAQGVSLFRRGAYGEAAEHFRKQVAAHPDDVSARLYLARIYRRGRDFPRAAAELRAGLAVAPEDAALQRELGFLLLDTGRPDAAVKRFQGAVLADSTAPDAWIGLVRALRASGQPAAAERVLARAPAEVRALMATPPAPPTPSTP